MDEVDKKKMDEYIISFHKNSSFEELDKTEPSPQYYMISVHTHNFFIKHSNLIHMQITYRKLDLIRKKI